MTGWSVNISRFAKIKNAFTAAGRTQNRLMKPGRNIVERTGHLEYRETYSAKFKPAKFYSKKLSDGSTMLQGYYEGSRTSDMTYLIGRDGSYKNIRRNAFDPEKKAGSLISGQSRVVEHYNRQGLLERIDVKSKPKIKGLETENVELSIYQNSPLNPNTGMDLRMGDNYFIGRMTNGGQFDYQTNGSLLGYKGGKFNVFEQLGKIIGLG